MALCVEVRPPPAAVLDPLLSAGILVHLWLFLSSATEVNVLWEPPHCFVVFGPDMDMYLQVAEAGLITFDS